MDSTKSLAAVILVGAVGVLGGALLFEHVGGLAPCVLCLWQRWPWWIAAAITLPVLLLPPVRRTLGPALPALFALLFAASFALAAYHVAVEQHWIAGPATCSAPLSGARTLADFQRMVVDRPVVRCDEVPWALFGVSLAGFNAIFSAILAVLSVRTLRRHRQGGLR
ncbi:disulfide bond formation protein DsbB [Stella humosa]|uniref:Disulfide bond formation protein DsbB n=1 Tax=Stella humosa TaxID=94 RepID=A0A3N1L090_9PROT|nr:disulfide bond formation protein B [Stella humosa]ROP84449.1 disulfide bond formation protein DsbB [Stella humosa]BBK33967.1 dihydroneopterin aldolase [Stella humosa]